MAIGMHTSTALNSTFLILAHTARPFKIPYMFFVNTLLNDLRHSFKITHYTTPLSQPFQRLAGRVIRNLWMEEQSS